VGCELCGEYYIQCGPGIEVQVNNLTQFLDKLRPILIKKHSDTKSGFETYYRMNYPAAGNEVSIGIFIITSRNGELNPCPPQAD